MKKEKDFDEIEKAVIILYKTQKIKNNFCQRKEKAVETKGFFEEREKTLVKARERKKTKRPRKKNLKRIGKSFIKGLTW